MTVGSYRVFDENGVKFQYPADWELTREEYEESSAITLQSEGAAFWSLTMFPDRPSAEHVADSTVAVFRGEYAELDEYPSQGVLCGQPAAARDLEFMYADLVSTTQIRALRTGRMTVLVLSQWTDQEDETLAPQLHDITNSLEVNFGDDLEIA